jgi:hypothetical protein
VRVVGVMMRLCSRSEMEAVMMRRQTNVLAR